MESVTSTTTRDILGLAVLAVLFERPSNRSEAVDAARGLCLPWLTPTREVVAVLLSEYCDAGYVRAANRFLPDTRPSGDIQLEITLDGERELRRLVLNRTGRPAHHLVILCESLRLSVVNRLDPSAQREVLRGQIRSRRRCLAMQRRRLTRAGNENPILAHSLRHQIACAQAELDALAGASPTEPAEISAFVHSYCHQIARAQAELDALAGESREDERDTMAFPPLST